MSELLEVSISELLMLWGELVEAYWGVNGYGGDTAEVYSYRFQLYSPIAHSHEDTETVKARYREVVSKAGNAFVALVNLFCDKFDCQAEVDNVSWRTWCYELKNGVREFGHRAHVKIIH